MKRFWNLCSVPKKVRFMKSFFLPSPFAKFSKSLKSKINRKNMNPYPSKSSGSIRGQNLEGYK